MSDRADSDAVDGNTRGSSGAELSVTDYASGLGWGPFLEYCAAVIGRLAVGDEDVVGEWWDEGGGRNRERKRDVM